MFFNKGLYSLLIEAIRPGGALSVILILAAHLFAAGIGYFCGAFDPAVIRSLFRKGDVPAPEVKKKKGKSPEKGEPMLLLINFAKVLVGEAVCGLLFGFSYVAAVSVNSALYAAGLFAVVGEIFPLVPKARHGGHGVTALAALMLVASPIVFLITAAVAFLMLTLTKYLSLSAVSAAFLHPLILYGYYNIVFGRGAMPGMISLFSMIAAVLITYTYKDNLSKITTREEPQFSFHKKEDGE